MSINCNGGTTHALNLAKARLGEVRTMKCGLKARIVEYNSATDIVIQFEDGTLRRCVYSTFKNGGVLKDKRNKNSSLLNAPLVSKTGYKYTVIELLNSIDCIIKFEDGITKKTTITAARRGSIAHPSQNRAKRPKESYIGETSRHTSGELMTVIAYRSCIDIDIRFGDGTIVTGKSYGSFKKGEIAKVDRKLHMLNEERIANCGLKMKIIDVINSTNITIQFEDGTIVYNKRYEAFKDGEIKHPTENSRAKAKEERLSMLIRNNQGVLQKIIKYQDAHNIDVEFEDGFILKNVSFTTYKSGYLGHPAFLRGAKTGIFANFIHTGQAYRLKDNNVFYYCQCQKCGHKDILSPRQMLQHQCEERNFKNE